MVQLVIHWPNMAETLGSISAPHKTGMGLHTCDPSTWELETGESEVHGHSRLHSRSGASLNYLRTFLKKTRKKIRLLACVEIERAGLGGEKGILAHL